MEKAPGSKRYEYVTGNLELMDRLQAGESLPDLMEEIGAKWSPGNEYLWDEYDPESLVDSDEKRWHAVNQLIYARIRVYRALRAGGCDPAGEDPFAFVDRVPELFAHLRARFPHTLGEPAGDAP